MAKRTPKRSEQGEAIHDPERPGLDVSSPDRNRAEADSSKCQDCGGNGWATIYHPDYNGSAILREIGPDGNERLRRGRTVAYCVCTLGRWMQDRHRKTAPDVFNRVPDLYDIKGKPSIARETDPTTRDAKPSEIAALPAGLRAQMNRIAQREFLS